MRAGRAAELGRCDSCVIRHKGICSALSKDELLRFRKIAHRRTFRPGEQILRGDERSKFCAAVYSGVVKLTKILFDGRQQVVGLMLPPDCLGRAFGKENPYFAEAATEVELCCFPYADFERKLDDFPGLKQRLLEQTLDELDSARDWMVLLGRKTAEERVASLLLMLARRASGVDCNGHIPVRPMAIDLHLKRHEIADFLGLTYETVCRQITSLKRMGLIQQPSRRRFAIPDPKALARAAG